MTDTAIVLRQVIDNPKALPKNIRDLIRNHLDAPASPSAPAVPVTDEQIKQAVTAAVRSGACPWMGYEKDEDGRYTLPVLSQMHYGIARAVLSAAPVVREPQDDLKRQLAEARADSERRHQLLIIQHAEAVELWNALKDLSFECDGVTRVDAPSRETYNRTFAVLQRKNHLSPEALRGHGGAAVMQQQSGGIGGGGNG